MQDVHVAESSCLHKLKQQKNFTQIKKQGLFFRKKGLVLRYFKTDQDCINWAVSASKYAYKKAVDRNLAKRRLKEILRQNPPRIYGNYLLSVTPSTNQTDFKELTHDYLTLLSKIPH
ncbi:MAG: ribonuclease P protein component [Alphaproteobacteria bacterium]|nr:MAG: ribonuclease P protein component [Alphaproteobacteria bacterium]